MPTPAERRALLFLGGLIILGGGVRAVRAVGAASSPPDSASIAALDRQLGAVDSARAANGAGAGAGGGVRRSRRRGARAGGSRGGRSADTGEDRRGGDRRGKGKAAPQTLPGVSPGSGVGVSTGAAPRPEVYYLAPGRRNDGPAERPGGGGRGGAGAGLAQGERVDVDRAPAADLERLPRVGPVLARRIVADRDSLGPYGSLEALRRVRGVGAAMLRILAPYVTFSTPPRQSGVVKEGGDRPRSRRRTRRVQPP